MNLADHLLRARELDAYARPGQKEILRQLAFAYYIRKGIVPGWVVTLQKLAEIAPPGFKFNPWHDPTNGQFTSGPSSDEDKKPEEADKPASGSHVIDQIGLFLQRFFGIAPAYAQGVDGEGGVESEDDENDAENDGLLDPHTQNYARIMAYSSAIAKLREVDPNNPALDTLSDPDAIPSMADITRVNQAISDIRNMQIADMLMPNGEPIGEPGRGFAVRIMSGTQETALEYMDQLTPGMTIDTPVGYRGAGYKLPDGGLLGIGQLAIAVNQPLT